MASARGGVTSLSPTSANEIGLRLIAEGRFENPSEAGRTGLRRLADDGPLVDRLAALGDEAMASGVDDGFDIDAFVEQLRAGK